MEITLPGTNGHAELPAQAPWVGEAQQLGEALSAETLGLRELLARERELAEPLQQALDACRERERRIEKAIAVLEGTEPKRGRPASSSPSASVKTKHAWTPRETTLDRVMTALGELGEGRASTVTEQSGLANETVRKCLEELRRREQVRVVRQDHRGPTYALMPNESGPDAA